MNPYGYGGFGTGFAGIVISLLLVILLWGLFWKGLGLWHSARQGNYRWFVAILIINSLGILELIYLFAILKLKFKDLFVVGEEKAAAVGDI